MLTNQWCQSTREGSHQSKSPRNYPFFLHQITGNRRYDRPLHHLCDINTHYEWKNHWRRKTHKRAINQAQCTFSCSLFQYKKNIISNDDRNLPLTNPPNYGTPDSFKRNLNSDLASKFSLFIWMCSRLMHSAIMNLQLCAVALLTTLHYLW